MEFIEKANLPLVRKTSHRHPCLLFLLSKTFDDGSSEADATVNFSRYLELRWPLLASWWYDQGHTEG
jgi:hypothetical protein